MGPDRRRSRILWVLQETSEPVTGSELAELLDVSRQVIVQDIALLRAAGHDIIATPRGYLIPGPTRVGTVTRTYATDHSKEAIEDELNLVVDHGGRILDVIVEHPLYGELRGLLMIGSRFDVQEFVRNMEEQHARPMLSLTGGPHLHTVEAESTEVLDRIEQALDAAGFLLRDYQDNQVS